MLSERTGLFRSAVTPHEDTGEYFCCWPCGGSEGVAFRWCRDTAATLPPTVLLCSTITHTHTHSAPNSQGVPTGKTSAFYRVPAPCWAKLCCAEMCAFPFYVNTSYQLSMCQHKLLAPLLKFRLPHYPDLSRIKLRRLKWTSPHSWNEKAQSAREQAESIMCGLLLKEFYLVVMM